MKYHKQEHLYVPGGETSEGRTSKGSCYPTVMACMLDLELHEVPYFHLFYYTDRERENLKRAFMEKYLHGKTYEEAEDWEKDNYDRNMSYTENLWNTILETWLYSQGYKEEFIPDIDQWLQENPDGFYFAGGLSSRGVSHIVIYQHGKLHHDPHPSNEGLVTLYQSPFTFLKKISE